MRHPMREIGSGRRHPSLRLLAAAGVGCVLALLVVLVWATYRNPGTISEARRADPTVPPTASLSPDEESLQRELEALRGASADEAMRANCWSWGGRGSGAIAAFNAKLPHILATLLAKPEAKHFSLEQLEGVFTAATGQPVALFAGDSDVWLAAIRPLYCAIGDHDSVSATVYVVDHSGHYWAIGSPRQILAAQWVEDRWIATADVASTLDAPPAKPEVWVISHETSGWTLTDTLLQVATPEIQGLTYSLKDGYRTLIATITYSMYGGGPPCEAIAQMPGYRNTLYEETQTYVWMDDHYEQVAGTPPQPITVIFSANSVELGDFLHIEVTPVYYEGTATPFSYWIDAWQPLCQ